MVEHSDQELIRQFQEEGSKAAFEQLVKRYVKTVRNFMVRLSIRESDADDLTQDVFIKVYRFLPDFRAEAKFTTWIYRIAANTAKSFFRKKGWQALSPDENIEILCQTNTHAAVDDLLTAELDERVSHAIMQLPNTFRAAIVLTAIENIPYSEAAKIEDCSMTTLYWRIFKGRQLLKKLLKEYLDE